MVQPADTTVRRVLLLAAHPNDEFALAATLARHVRAGDEVWAAWFAHDDRPIVDQRRRIEAESAMERIGVQLDRLVWAELPAQMLPSLLAELVHAVRYVLGLVEPDLIYVPAYEGGHPDHDALNFAVWETAGQAGVACREFPMYRRERERHWLARIPRFARMLPGIAEPDLCWLDPHEVDFKHDLWRVYRSQRPLFDVLLRISGDERRFFSTEQSRILPLRDYTKPPHDRPLLYEDQTDGMFTFDEFAAMVRRYQWSGGVDEGEGI